MFYCESGTTFQQASRAEICKGTFDIVSKEVLWSVLGSHQTICGPPLPNVTRHSGWWPSTVTPSLDLALYQFLTLLLILTLLQNLTFYLIARFLKNICNGCGMPTDDAYSSGHLVLSHFGTCKCSNVETNLSWTCLVSGLLSFEHPSVRLFLLRMSQNIGPRLINGLRISKSL